MKLTFLGTGTSQGIPVIGCKCEVCQSLDPRDQRWRTSAMLTTEAGNIVIDTGPDFRMQMLTNQVDNLEAVLITHEHNDHIIGLDDIRPFYFKKRSSFSYYVTRKVGSEIKTRFPYVFSENPYPGAPQIEINNFEFGSVFSVIDLEVLPIKVLHGKMEVASFRVRDFIYLTDAGKIPEASMRLMKGVKTLVINALRNEPHHSHFSLNEALNIISILQPQRAYLTHLSHLLGKTKEIEKKLPYSVSIAYDGLEIDL